jgi:hypothetical protein
MRWPWGRSNNGYAGWQRSTHRVREDLQAVQADCTNRRRLQRLTSDDVLALNDFGPRPLSPRDGRGPGRAFRDRYQKVSVLAAGRRHRLKRELPAR